MLGTHKKATVPDLFQSTREEWLTEARATARKLLTMQRTITIEDVLKECPRPSYLHRNVTGNVFHDKDFKLCGYAKSKRPISNGRVISVWTLNEAHMPFVVGQVYRGMGEL